MPEYIARDPRTGLPIRKASSRSGRNLGPLTPPLGRWAVIPQDKIIPLARSDLAAVEIPSGDGGGFATRNDAVVALYRVFEDQLNRAHETLSESIDDDDPAVRLSAIMGLPRMMLRKSENLMYQLIVRLDDSDTDVSDAAWETLERIAPIFPSSSELRLEDLSQEGRSRG